jgi:hypothetical protein
MVYINRLGISKLIHQNQRRLVLKIPENKPQTQRIRDWKERKNEMKLAKGRSLSLSFLSFARSSIIIP